MCAMAQDATLFRATKELDLHTRPTFPLRRTPRGCPPFRGRDIAEKTNSSNHLVIPSSPE